MAVFMRSKRVTDPLNDKVKACICGNQVFVPHSTSSSGSEHEGEDQCESDCLSHLIHDFLETEGVNDNEDSFIKDDSINSDSNHHESQAKESLKALLSSSDRLLVHHLSVAMKMFDSLKDKSVRQRKVMMFLRELGHNAGICKTRWESAGGITSGNYESIDVVNNSARYIIDIDFAGEFEIARPTSHYTSLLQLLPRVYIGRSEELKQIVRLMCEAAKRSLKSRDLHLPPWRKNRYMQLKWFGAYRRTINPIPSNVTVSAGAGAKCRAVGFDTVSNGDGRFYFPAATRTR